MPSSAPALPLPRLAWRVIAYLVLVAAATSFLRGSDRPSHGTQLAAVTVGVLRLIGEPAVHAGEVVSGAGFAMRVAPVCDGLDLGIILGLAILLSPAPWRARLTGTFLALALTQIFNIGRLVVMFLVGVHLHEHFDLFHHVLWQAVAILFCVALYAVWLARLPLAAGDRP